MARIEPNEDLDMESFLYILGLLFADAGESNYDLYKLYFLFIYWLDLVIRVTRQSLCFVALRSTYQKFLFNREKFKRKCDFNLL